ncbi:beta-galactosidase [Pseudothermotoga sp.]
MLGVCYYPEHWSREQVENDVRLMQELGIRFVRIGEFAWSRIEPSPDQFNWHWLDEVLNLFERFGLKVILGTPTATPPKWLVDKYPEILPVDENGRRRNFGSRRHYCFSNRVYRQESQRIVREIALRYGKHPVVVGWQTDNEYGCHNTARCYCSHCRKQFQEWLKTRYGTIDRLNEAWGSIFWSQEYRTFEEVELPNLTVAEPNPAHVLDFYRFASDQIKEFNELQVRILREFSPGRFVTHNFMGGFTDFDHFSLAADLDLASWDNYPLGHSQVFLGEQADTYARSGHPDLAAFNHDLYRGVGRGRFWVMEQQAGPVNWAPRNLSPAPGMVRLWTWEALAHGAEVVSYFRWRQVPFAQEQMHSGLFLPDSTPDTGFYEVKKIVEELKAVELPKSKKADVALIFDYESAWVYEIQPHGEGVDYRKLVFHFYSALRQLGLDVDVLSPNARLEDYRLVVVPSLPIVRDEALTNLSRCQGIVVFGPRSGSKTENFQIPKDLPLGPLRKFLPLKVVRVESLGPKSDEKVIWQGREYPVNLWKEWIETNLKPEATWKEGKAALVRNNNYYYLGFWPSETFLLDFFELVASEVGLNPIKLAAGIRIRRRGNLVFAFNYTNTTQKIPVLPEVQFLVGAPELRPYDVAIWKES